MSSDVAALSFQAHANYGTWSIDFEPYTIDFCFKKSLCDWFGLLYSYNQLLPKLDFYEIRLHSNKKSTKIILVHPTCEIIVVHY